MKQGRIVVITGAPGTGKTTAASIIAKESDMEKSVHMHKDGFYRYLSKGAIPPQLLEKYKNAPSNSPALFDRYGELKFIYAKVHTCDFDAERNLTAGEDFYVATLDTS